MKRSELILFDLDGLLVDTEEFHFHAYQAACERFGCALPWNFHEYLLLSGSSATALHDKLRLEVPELFRQCSWEDLYAEKKAHLKNLLFSRPIPLMPGVRECVEKFFQEKMPMAVVTNSSQVFTDIVIRSHPFFSTISCWIFREKYKEPKPSPEGYLLACKEMGVPLCDQAIIPSQHRVS
jgi:beta-phosphoglucomutase-like phosphatase (HAD superfamily)